VAGRACGHAITAKLHVPEESFAQSNCSILINDKIVQFLSCGTGNLNGFQRSEFALATAYTTTPMPSIAALSTSTPATAMIIVGVVSSSATATMITTSTIPASAAITSLTTTSTIVVTTLGLSTTVIAMSTVPAATISPFRLGVGEAEHGNQAT
jgi:hypothetical protein